MKLEFSTVARCFAILSFVFTAQVFADASAPLPGHSVLTLKGGSFRLRDDSQRFNNHSWHFDRSSRLFGFEGEGWIDRDKHVSVGGELFYSRINFRRDDISVSHYLDTRAWLVKSKYYFGSRNDAWRPYLGGGVGIVSVTDHGGPIGGNAEGTGYQAVAGMQWRSERIGVRTEYSFLQTDVDDESQQKIRASGHAFFIGVSFYLGRAR